MNVPIFDSEAVRRELTPAACTALMQDVLKKEAAGEYVQYLRTAIDLPNANVLGLMPGWLGDCFGVKAMAAQAKDGGVFQLRRESMSKGIETQLGEDGSVSLGLHIAVDHGVNLMALCRSIINEVSYKVSKATGVPVKRVDVYVDTMLID